MNDAMADKALDIQNSILSVDPTTGKLSCGCTDVFSCDHEREDTWIPQREAETERQNARAMKQWRRQ